MNPVEAIAERLDVFTVLSDCGIDHAGRKRLPCPVHHGDGLNFAILDDGRGWKCFSHDCGAGRKRDGVNLFCLLRYGAPLPDLPQGIKGDAVRTLAGLAGVALDDAPMNRMPVPKFVRLIPNQEERCALGMIFRDTSLLDRLGKTRMYESQAAQWAITYLSLAKVQGELPARIDESWPHFKNMEAYIHAHGAI